MIFPIPHLPDTCYKTGSRRFGANRGKNRKHAGCDLLTAVSTPVLAVADGIIIRGPYLFYRGTFALEIQHRDFIARYCEIKLTTPKNVCVGNYVKAGQTIGYVSKLFSLSMLHFELYSGEADGKLTQRSENPFKRRTDLVDPTPFLDHWAYQLKNRCGFDIE